jgi:hypothetical protein
MKKATNKQLHCDSYSHAVGIGRSREDDIILNLGPGERMAE